MHIHIIELYPNWNLSKVNFTYERERVEYFILLFSLIHRLQKEIQYSRRLSHLSKASLWGLCYPTVSKLIAYSSLPPQIRRVIIITPSTWRATARIEWGSACESILITMHYANVMYNYYYYPPAVQALSSLCVSCFSIHKTFHLYVLLDIKGGKIIFIMLF